MGRKQDTAHRRVDKTVYSGLFDNGFCLMEISKDFCLKEIIYGF